MGLNWRAQIVLLASQGLQNKDIAPKLGMGRVQVARWRHAILSLACKGIELNLPRDAPALKVSWPRLLGPNCGVTA